jgi:Zn finger protein HypA/HybF involved in hydrogenase expression
MKNGKIVSSTLCENCNCEHDGNYGSGRFCGCKCARGFSSKEKRKETNEKIAKKLRKYCIPDFSKEQIESIVSISFSTKEVANILLPFIKREKRRFFETRKLIKKFSINTSHFIGCGIFLGNKGYTKELFIQSILTFNTERRIKSSTIKNRLIRFKIKENKCEECKLQMWNNKPLVLQLHHIDGNRYNNTLENLQILCPNCHSQTDTFGNKRRN